MPQSSHGGLAPQTMPLPENTSLPAQVRGDMLIQKIRTSLGGGRIIESLDHIGVYRRLGIPLPLALLMLEARLAALGKIYPRAIAALEAYLSRADAPADGAYPDALALYDDMLTAQEIASSREMEARRKAARGWCVDPGPTKDLAAGTIFRDGPALPEMVVIPGGSFLMGSTAGDPDATPLEQPQHRVSIGAFAVSRFAITFDDWELGLTGGGYQHRPEDRWGRGRQPVINVSWHDAIAYVGWLSKVTGKHYRLLSEAEWEYAARGGRETPFTTGTAITPAAANILNPEGTVEVGRFPPNDFGLHDMHGNVWEWTADYWNPDYNGAPEDGSAWESGDGRARTFRGGCWYNAPQAVRLSFRFSTRTTARNPIIGIRVARELD